MRYGRDLGCRFGWPHDIHTIHETERVKWEVCGICNKKFRWNKTAKGRSDNRKYLKAHVRNFAQRGGATHRMYMKLYEPEKCIIKL